MIKLNYKVILFGFIFTFFSSFGQSFFIGLFNSSIREEHKRYILERNKRIFNLELPYSFNDYSHYISKGLLDFSQSYWLLSEDYLKEIKQSLSHFNIKIILLYREPVQRLYSYCNMICADWNCNDSSRELFDKYVYDCGRDAILNASTIVRISFASVSLCGTILKTILISLKSGESYNNSALGFITIPLVDPVISLNVTLPPTPGILLRMPVVSACFIA